jgi:hypothetical protein
METRRGNFSDYYGPIFIRNVVGIRTVPKYPIFPNRWVLEVYAPEVSIDILTHNGYEPLYVFDNNGRALDPIWRAIAYIVGRANSPVKKTDADVEQDLDDQMEAERQFYLDYLTDKETVGIKEGNSVIVS